MGLDSVELILAWEESFGITLSDAEAAHVFTTRQVTNLIYQKVRDTAKPEDTGCLSMRAYYRLRRSFQREGINFDQIKATSKFSDILPRKDQRERLNQVLITAGFDPLRRMPFGLQFTFGRVKDYILDLVISHHSSLRTEGTSWSREQVREVVRSITKAQLAIVRLQDDSRFVQDLGMD